MINAKIPVDHQFLLQYELADLKRQIVKLTVDRQNAVFFSRQMSTDTPIETLFPGYPFYSPSGSFCHIDR